MWNEGVSVSTSTDENEMLDNSVASEALVSEVKNVDLSLITSIEDYVEQVIAVLSNPSIPFSKLNIISQKIRNQAINSNNNNNSNSKAFKYNAEKSTPPPLSQSVNKTSDFKFDFIEGENINFKKILLGAVEYVALFRANRPMQSEKSNVDDIRITEEIYLDLLHVSTIYEYFAIFNNFEIFSKTYELKVKLKDLKAKFDEDITNVIKTLSIWLAERADYLKNAQIRDLELARSAYRSRLSDSIAGINHDSEVKHFNDALV